MRQESKNMEGNSEEGQEADHSAEGIMGLNGKTVLITGASSGIGKATALAFAKEGANLALLARNETNLRRAEDELKSFRIRTLVVPADVSQREQVQRAASRIHEEFGVIDILVCSAGMYHRSPISEIGIEDFKLVMDVNFFGTLHCIYAFLPQMIERKQGDIVIISSMDGKKGLPFDGAYVSSKFALAGSSPLAEIDPSVLTKDDPGDAQHMGR
jgi:3-oxoacyl-[acyl-carrier protein] reductase